MECLENIKGGVCKGFQWTIQTKEITLQEIHSKSSPHQAGLELDSRTPGLAMKLLLRPVTTAAAIILALRTSCTVLAVAFLRALMIRCATMCRSSSGTS